MTTMPDETDETTIELPELLEYFLHERRLYDEFMTEIKIRQQSRRRSWKKISMDPSYFIDHAFFWESTPQGHHFWRDVKSEWQKFLKEWESI